MLGSATATTFFAEMMLIMGIDGDDYEHECDNDGNGDDEDDSNWRKLAHYMGPWSY